MDETKIAELQAALLIANARISALEHMMIAIVVAIAQHYDDPSLWLNKFCGQFQNATMSAPNESTPEAAQALVQATRQAANVLLINLMRNDPFRPPRPQ